MNKRKKLPRGNSQVPNRICPDPAVCKFCSDSKDCQYVKNQVEVGFLEDLFKIIERRVSIGGTCLVNVRNLARSISNNGSKHLSSKVDNTLTTIGAIFWGQSCSEHRLKKWNTRPNASRIYQVDEVVLESFRWYIDRMRHNAGGREMKKKCPRCNGELVENTILAEVDFSCTRCGRGWKLQPDGKWHSRFTATLEIYDSEGKQEVIDK